MLDEVTLEQERGLCYNLVRAEHCKAQGYGWF
jgi:hypothetical protein